MALGEQFFICVQKWPILPKKNRNNDVFSPNLIVSFISQFHGHIIPLILIATEVFFTSLHRKFSVVSKGCIQICELLFVRTLNIYIWTPFRGNSHYHKNANCVKLCQKGPENRVTSIFFSNNSDLYFGEPFMTLLIWNEQNLVEKKYFKG